MSGRRLNRWPTFYRRVAPSPEEMESMLRVGAFDEFGKTRTAQFWECQFLQRSLWQADVVGQGLLLPPPGLDRLPEVPLAGPTRRERLEAENELLGFPASGHPLELTTHCLGYLLPGVAAGRARRRGSGDVRAGGGTTHPPPNHRRTDEVPDPCRLDGHGGNGIVRPDLQELTAWPRCVTRFWRSQQESKRLRTDVGIHCGLCGRVNQGKRVVLGFAEIGIIRIACHAQPRCFPWGPDCELALWISCAMPRNYNSLVLLQSVPTSRIGGRTRYTRCKWVSLNAVSYFNP